MQPGTAVIPRLDVPFADTSAEALRISLDHPRIAPLDSRVLDLGEGLALELHVIGSSHQVVLTSHGADAFVETFACLDTDDRQVRAPDWDRETITAGSWAGFTRHAFSATRMQVTGDFLPSVAEAAARSRAHSPHLVVEFPGDPGAVTALCLTTADDSGGTLAWRTWHCYPQTATIVESTSTLTRDTTEPFAHRSPEEGA